MIAVARMARLRARAWGRRAAAGLAAAAIAAAMLAGAVSPAAAHAALLRSEPADDAMLAAGPERFRLIFNEAVAPLVLKLVAPDGAVRTLDGATARGAEIAIPAPAGLAQGSYALSWRVVSEDGHPIGGTLAFSVGARSASAATAAPDRTREAAVWAARLALYGGLFLGVGGAFALAWLGGGRGDRLAAAAMTAGLGAAAFSLGLQGADALDAPISTLLQPIVWTTGLATSFGRTALAAAAALALGLASLAVSGGAAKGLAALALAGVGAALAASGHAAAAEPQWLTRPAVFVHAVGVAFWLGALAPLGLALAAGGPDAAAALRRFSRVAPLAVAALVVAGVALAAVQLGEPSALWTTAYGAVLAAKLALLAPLFVLAAYNRHLTRPALAGDTAAAKRLRRSIGAEIALAALILGAVALWRFTPPPRSLALAAEGPVAVHIHTARAMADLMIAPGRSGRTDVIILIMTGDFGPLAAKEVTLVVSNPMAGLEPIRRRATAPGDGTWRVDGLVLPAPGHWTARLDILVSDYEMVKLDGAFDLAR